eukprot:CAMPEP_0113551914 /NCGR_PEP_ID=MMETSP0015_2-20120614/14776_1 /TAXON_ID=2838 /ORGANISM="Odontella" /LENGTH=109 /DNA_ID=CAMNT_0000452833 /DNA_START=281 /DNA_END=610 /DNA_ORIENTATION=- /assembly_acc=CAM_ASM_000160
MYSTTKKRHNCTGGRPTALDIVDDAWAADTLSDDEIDVNEPLLDEGELDVDAVVVSTGHSGSAANGAAERRKREEGRWNDLGLDHFDSTGSGAASTQRTGRSGTGGQQQ